MVNACQPRDAWKLIILMYFSNYAAALQFTPLASEQRKAHCW